MSGCRYAVQVKRLVHHQDVPGWCGKPYPGHPVGCPNFKSGKPQCPVRAPYIDSIMDLNRACWLVFSEFDLAGHMARMKQAHPTWTERQLRNVLYWQRASKAQMKQRATAWARYVGADFIHPMAEAAGVNLYATAALSGLKLQRIKEITICRHVALVGWRKQ